MSTDWLSFKRCPRPGVLKCQHVTELPGGLLKSRMLLALSPVFLILKLMEPVSEFAFLTIGTHFDNQRFGENFELISLTPTITDVNNFPFLFIFIEVELIYKVVLVLGVQKRDSEVIYDHM